MTFEAILERVAGPAAPRDDAPWPELPTWKPDPPLAPREKPDQPYGLLLGEELHACSREELADSLAGAPTIPAVWTPETEALARPEDVPSLLPDLRERARKAARANALFSGRIAAVVVALVIAAELAWGFGSRTIFYLFAVLAAVDCGWWVLRLRAGDTLAPVDFVAEREEARHAEWMSLQKAPLTRLLVWCIGIVVVIAGAEEERSLAVAGLVKELAWAEPFRLLTASVLHVSIVHAWMNGTALLWVGKLLEAHAPRGRMPLVFLVSALGGSLASAALLPATSLGASGGILGIVGYLMVMAYRRPHQFPRGLVHRMGYVVGATALLGMLGFAMIDNAGHGGGLVAGMLLARALVTPEERPEPAWLRWAGWASLAIITAAAAGALYLIFFDPLGSAAGL